MDHLRRARFAPALRRISSVSAQACIVLGCLVLIGWAFKLPTLECLRPGLANMTVNTAIGFILAGSALLARARGTAWGRSVCRGVAAFLIWRGSLKILGAASGLDLGLDQWLFPDYSPAHGSMAVLTATNFILIGAALLGLGIHWKRQVLSEWLAGAAALLAMMALLGKAYNVPPPFLADTYATVAPHTSLGFLLCSLAIVLFDPGRGMAMVLADAGPSGVFARRLVPLSIIVPLVLGWICLAGEQRSLYSTEYALTLMVLACIFCGITFSLWAARATKKAGTALSVEEERLRVTLRSIGDGVIAVDLEMRVTTVNAVAEALTGWTQEEAVGRLVQEVFRMGGTADGQPMADPIVTVLRLDETFQMKEPFILIDRSGHEITVADSSAPIHDVEGRMIGAVLVFRDVSAKVRADKELLKLQKLESLAVLASGIAHDFNNILSVILANVSLAAEEKGTVQMDCLRDAEAAVDRGAQLSGQLMAFAKGGAAVRKPVALGPIIEEAARFALTGTSSRVAFELGKEAAVAEADPGQLSQVLQNLVLNASQAMPSGGLVHVALLSLDVVEGGALPLPAGRYHQIVVTDEGLGIPPEILEHIFEPFFTTKPKGNGLGLASAFSIAKSHRGLLTAETLLGHGSAFSLYLPASSRAAADVARKPGRAVGGRGRVLVMDDDAAILKVSLQMISSLGYRVRGAANGVGAIAQLKAALDEGDPYDVAILDLTVPGAMGGRETLQQLHALQPTLRAIVASGYSTDPVMERPGDYGFADAIPKPYNLYTMGDALRGLIGTEMSPT